MYIVAEYTIPEFNTNIFLICTSKESMAINIYKEHHVFLQFPIFYSSQQKAEILVTCLVSFP